MQIQKAAMAGTLESATRRSRWSRGRRAFAHHREQCDPPVRETDQTDGNRDVTATGRDKRPGDRGGQGRLRLHPEGAGGMRRVPFRRTDDEHLPWGGAFNDSS